MRKVLAILLVIFGIFVLNYSLKETEDTTPPDEYREYLDSLRDIGEWVEDTLEDCGC